MTIEWREWLYPLGFLSAVAFSGRMLLQWGVSESRQKSVVTRGFWTLSLIGNLLLIIHSLIQVQFHVCLAQAINAVISWRNLDLMNRKRPPKSLRRTLAFMIAAMLLVVAVFVFQGIMTGDGSVNWFRIPTNAWSTPIEKSVSLLVHASGIIGIILFSGRFWVQWWLAEQSKESCLGTPFWLLSLIGTLLSLFYFAHIQDPVNFIGPAFGIIPYVRNLMLLRKSKPIAVPLQQ